jgi:ferredoxin-NADP reductase
MSTELTQVTNRGATDSDTGDDILTLRVRSRRALSGTVEEFVLEDAAGAALPHWTPGSHLAIRVGDGTDRQYSLCGDPADETEYRIAVQREATGRGGSIWMHDAAQAGTLLHARTPRNNFPLTDATSYHLVAGGIGITPLISMARHLEAVGASWRMTYLGRSREVMAFLEELESDTAHVHVHVDEERGMCDISAAIGAPTHDTVVYSCGPEPLLRAIEGAMAEWPPVALRVERFVAKEIDTPAEAEQSFEVELTSSGEVLTVPPQKSILEVLEDAGKTPLFSCREGTCGTCESVIVSGEADHRDSILSPEEQEAQESMMICVSRAKSSRMVLDL